MSSCAFTPFGISIRSVSPSFAVALALWLLLSRLTLAQQITTVAGGNGSGPAPNQLNYPQSIAVDGAGNLYVTEFFANAVKKFPPNSTSATAGTTVAGGNGEGSAANQLKNPQGVYVDGAGKIYVGDYLNGRVQQFPPNSTSATAGTTVAGVGGQVFGVYVDASGNLYVANPGAVLKYPPNSTSATAGTVVAGGLNSARGVVMDGAGNLYVADRDNNRVQQFPPNSTSATAGVTVAGGNGAGSAPNQLMGPTGVAVDGLGNLYVVDSNNDRVQKYSYSPVILSQPVASTYVCAGATVTAQVSATAVIAGATFSYQWYSASGPLSGQTSPTLSLTNVQPGPATNYYVVITSTSSGLSTTSTTFTLNVLASPVVSLVASGPLSPANPTVTLTASGGSLYRFSPGATQVGNGPTATVSAPGVYSVFVTGNTGCSNLASTTVVQAPVPDLTPQLYARPTSLYGNTPVTVVVDVVELNGVASSGLVTLKIAKDSKLSLSLPASATSIDNRPVSNSVWQLSGPSNGYYTLTTNQSVPAGYKLSVGLTGTFSPGGSSGGLNVSGTLVGGSGGEQNALNNTATNRVDYFQQ